MMTLNEYIVVGLVISIALIVIAWWVVEFKNST